MVIFYSEKSTTKNIENIFEGNLKKTGMYKNDIIKTQFYNTLFRNGATLRYLQEIFRHKISKTIKIYTKVININLSKTIKQLAKILLKGEDFYEKG